MEKNYVRLDAKGHIDIVTLDGDDKLRDWYGAIDCNVIDILQAKHLPEPYVLIVDDEALLKSDPILNPVASIMYGARGHKQPLFGHVLIGKDYELDDGEVETGGYSLDDAADIVGAILTTLSEAMVG